MNWRRGTLVNSLLFFMYCADSDRGSYAQDINALLGSKGLAHTSSGPKARPRLC